MRYLVTSVLLVLLVSAIGLSCKKWEDPAAINDPRINTPYCNDPDAVNYNWNFPGKPDNTTCYYPSDLLAGNYTLNDTIYDATSDLYLAALARDMSIVKISHNQVSVAGFCDQGTIVVTAWAPYFATVDTTMGDSLSERQGQTFCRMQDTVTGYFARDKVDSTLVYIELFVKSDTGRTIHRAFAKKR